MKPAHECKTIDDLWNWQDENGPVMVPAVAAEMCHMSRQGFWQAIDRGEFTLVYCGKRIFVPVAEVREKRFGANRYNTTVGPDCEHVRCLVQSNECQRT